MKHKNLTDRELLNIIYRKVERLEKALSPAKTEAEAQIRREKMKAEIHKQIGL